MACDSSVASCAILRRSVFSASLLFSASSFSRICASGFSHARIRACVRAREGANGSARVSAHSRAHASLNTWMRDLVFQPSPLELLTPQLVLAPRSRAILLPCATRARACGCVAMYASEGAFTRGFVQHAASAVNVRVHTFSSALHTRPCAYPPMTALAGLVGTGIFFKPPCFVFFDPGFSREDTCQQNPDTWNLFGSPTKTPGSLLISTWPFA